MWAAAERVGYPVILKPRDGVTIAMVHDSGNRKGRERRMHRRFPEADLVLFGHKAVGTQVRVPVDMADSADDG